jgi:hypothetical protein
MQMETVNTINETIKYKIVYCISMWIFHKWQSRGDQDRYWNLYHQEKEVE